MTCIWHLSVSTCTDQGSREYMEDFICHHVENIDRNILFEVFGIFDGHGGSDAASYVQRTFVEEIKRNNNFWNNDDDSIKIAIKDVYCRIQNLLWIEREKWPQTSNGFKSTCGTTATIAIIRNDKIYIANVGDSAIIIANQNNHCLRSDMITKEHKPSDSEEKRRIESNGGSVKCKAGITRVVWNRRKKLTKNEIEHLSFLAVSRSLGDLWSYDFKTNNYHVSPEPDVSVIKLNPTKHRALILASDGVWNVIDGQKCVDILHVSNNVEKFKENTSNINPAEVIVNYSLYKWKKKNLKSDNISAIVIKLTPNGYKNQRIFEKTPHLEKIFSKIIDNRLISSYNYNQSVDVLHIVEDFNVYLPYSNKVIKNISEETEILKMFIMSIEKLARYCLAWTNDVLYWEQLKLSFEQIGNAKLPSIFLLYESDEDEFESLLNSFSWAFICQRYICESKLKPDDIRMIRSEPLLSTFWNAFYQQIISTNFSFTIEQLTETSVYKMIMRHTLMHKAGEISHLTNQLLCEQITRYNLNKCHSYNCTQFSNNAAHSLYSGKKLQRSSSLKLSELAILPQVSSTLSTNLNSNSSTPPMSPNRSESEIFNEPAIRKPMLIRRHSGKTKFISVFNSNSKTSESESEQLNELVSQKPMLIKRLSERMNLLSVFNSDSPIQPMSPNGFESSKSVFQKPLIIKRLSATSITQNRLESSTLVESEFQKPLLVKRLSENINLSKCDSQISFWSRKRPNQESERELIRYPSKRKIRKSN